MVTKVVRILPHEFQGQNNEVVKGTYLYLTITKESGNVETRRVFVSDDRMAEWAYVPREGDSVLVFAKDGKVVDMLKA